MSSVHIAENVPKISLDDYGEPPDPPSLQEIIDDIRKATLDDIVFKSSSSISKVSSMDEDILKDEGM